MTRHRYNIHLGMYSVTVALLLMVILSLTAWDSSLGWLLVQIYLFVGSAIATDLSTGGIEEVLDESDPHGLIFFAFLVLAWLPHTLFAHGAALMRARVQVQEETGRDGDSS